MAGILAHPDALALLEQTRVEPSSRRRCRARRTRFVGRYLPCLYRQEQRRHAQTVLEGKLTGLDRKTTEPLATQARQPRGPLQHFVGAGRWSDATVRSERARHGTMQLGEEDGVLIIDPSRFPNKGKASCGVGRQWCGRLGKTDNCQVGVFVASASSRGTTLVDAQLYLQQERAADRAPRRKTHVATAVEFQEKWRLAWELLHQRGSPLPHTWVCADDERGRGVAFRRALRNRRERYVLEVPCETLLRDGAGFACQTRQRYPVWERVDTWTARQKKKRWQRVVVKKGTKGPLVVWARQQGVPTKEEDGAPGTMELLTVLRTGGKNPQFW